MKGRTLLILVLSMLLLTACTAASDPPDEQLGPAGGEPSVNPGDADAQDDLVVPGGPDEPLSASRQKEAFDIYTSLMSGINVQPGEDMQFDMDMETDMTIDTDGMSMTMTMSGNIKTIVEDGKMMFSYVMDMGPLAGTMEMFYDGGTFYFAVNGEEVDLALFDIHIDELINETVGSAINMPEFDPGAIKYFNTELTDGNEKVTIIIDGAALTDFTLSSMDMGEMADLLDDIDMSIEDVLMELTVGNDGAPKYIRMVMSMDMTVEGIRTKMDMDMRYTINAVGSGVVIAA